jgi:hypothetical protein
MKEEVRRKLEEGEEASACILTTPLTMVGK